MNTDHKETAMNLHAKGKAARGTGWIKWQNNPVLGGNLGTCFDLCLIRDANSYRMWFSWRPQKSIALVESKDGIHWSEPVIVLGPETSSGWEDDINRPCVIKRGDTYHMWYTGQARGQSWIGHAVSTDGKNWIHTSNQPVLSPELPWEKMAVMCPHVIWDEATGLYKMWYSGGEQYEPDAIGYATSPDGQTWTRQADTPIFYADPTESWEQYKVTACQVIPFEGWYLMFYVGFRDIDHAQIGLARSRDGITNWQRHPANPIISSGENTSSWDYDAAYKPFALHEQGRWLLWYNGRRDTFEQIGFAIHTGDDLQFDALTEENNR